MTIEVVGTCPYGSKCEEIRDNKIYRCNLYIQLAGTDPGSGQLIDQWRCAQAWIPILLVENSMQQRNTAAAVESFRNEMVKANSNIQTNLLSNQSGVM